MYIGRVEQSQGPPILVQGNARVCMAKPTGHRDHVGTRRDQETGVRVPGVMDADRTQAGPTQAGMPDSRPPIASTYGETCARRRPGSL